ncbi:MAG: hypothetical protein GEU95_11715 [Rhizobiales bacterium]|nr:hypothetical protein [Hyphomicrobiales bacterium]
MRSIRFALLAAGGIFTGATTAETADCRAQLTRQDEQCQALAEKLAEACPSGTKIKEIAQCRELSTQIANTCTRKPCAAPPRKRRRATSRSRGMGAAKGMGETRSKPTRKPTKKSN